MTFGHGSADFFANSPACVGQAVLTGLELIRGEWFLDLTAGVDYPGQIIGEHQQADADSTIRAAILGVLGVTEIVSYSSTVTNRKLSVTATINTLYGQTTISTVLP